MSNEKIEQQNAETKISKLFKLDFYRL